MNPLAPALLALVVVAFGVRGAHLVATAGQPRGLAIAAPEGVRRVRRPVVGRLVERLSDRLEVRALALLNERRRERVRDRLDAAGRPRHLTLERYAGRKAAFMLIFGAAGVVLLLQGNLPFCLVLEAMGVFWFDLWLSGVAKRRQHHIERQLPDFLDVLSVAVGAGVGFRTALARVGESLGGPLGEEVALTLQQMQLGASRRAAFKDLRRRNSAESLGRMVALLLQAEELGTPMAASLVEIACEMRRTFAQDARRRAARAAPRVSLIITTVIVPGIILVVVGTLVLGSGLNLGGLSSGS